ncbi:MULTISPECIES: type IV pilus modification protein PilV [Pseudoxanthomonas]|uniref:Type IV pilus assembly protein PilV n=1 Tax=Pseudoxanthomonas taiwanensis J19 TaxID=935569 RepID=A0A562DL73_9GAMM|nr:MULTISPECIES: type IV pilus modification protein PilV [Pseudoxanthomonas]RRN80617.1 type IV pilus modification protein PilV [Pseudoxanthomonas sp. SGD-10]TWH10401.1 type IV pilus assembly protein PilV [Pseudoxanthomonas taiwanensis J19]
MIRIQTAAGARAGRRPGPRWRRQAGVSLLEVMISVLILGIGLLGIAAMQATALRNGQSSLERTQAVMQTYAILDVLRANRTNAIAGYYNTSGMQCTPANPDASLPAGQQSAQGELNVWLVALKTSMGQAGDTTTCANVACAGNAVGGGTCTVTIQWDDSRGSTANASGQASETGEGSSTRQVVTVSAL